MQLDATTLGKETESDNTPVEVVLFDRSGNPCGDEDGTNPSAFLVVGKYSDAVRAHDRREARQLIRHGLDKPTLEQLEDKAIERQSAAVVGWKNIKGEFSSEAVKAILRAMPWNQDRVVRAMEQPSAFFSSRSAS
jgi:hypothetical protein